LGQWKTGLIGLISIQERKNGMVSELRKRKFSYLFHCFDFDKNGILEKADYEQFAKNLGKAYGLATDSTKYATMHAETMALWDFVQSLADQNGDNQVTVDEFIVGYTALTNNDEAFHRLLMGYADYVIRSADRDGNGELDKEEYATILGCYGIETAAAHDAFRRLDEDGNGSLSVTDMEKAFEEYFRSDNPDAPGNWMMGPF
jgi:Ca2+-binding EF-hand superfamily protein